MLLGVLVSLAGFSYFSQDPQKHQLVTPLDSPLIRPILFPFILGRKRDAVRRRCGGDGMTNSRFSSNNRVTPSVGRDFSLFPSPRRNSRASLSLSSLFPTRRGWEEILEWKSSSPSRNGRERGSTSYLGAVSFLLHISYNGPQIGIDSFSPPRWARWGDLCSLRKSLSLPISREKSGERREAYFLILGIAWYGS